jgi:hypothetical protein
MKIFLTLALTVGCLLNANAEDQPSHFQLVSGSVETIGAPGKLVTPIILRIDTQTGKTWIYARLFTDGKFQEFWTPVAEKMERPK